VTNTRIEHWHNADAPAANSLVPASNLLVVNDDGAILLQQRRDTGQWALPGGKQDLGETPRQCAVRECWEETGILAEVTGLLGVYSDPAHLIEYTSDGEVRQEYEVTFLGRPVSGSPTANDEASAVQWVSARASPPAPRRARQRARSDERCFQPGSGS
jgi:8-oxo-dGTP pyrophosphatase MutT (NUDIX family)